MLYCQNTISLITSGLDVDPLTGQPCTACHTDFNEMDMTRRRTGVKCIDGPLVVRLPSVFEHCKEASVTYIVKTHEYTFMGFKFVDPPGFAPGFQLKNLKSFYMLRAAFLRGQIYNLIFHMIVRVSNLFLAV